MAQKQAFQCPHCKAEVLAPEEENHPSCCGKSMESIPLDQCTLATTAEHARFDIDDEPCDDGRSG